jgi:aminopeptidase N
LRIGQGQDQVDAFYAKWADDRLVLDKWFMMQVALAPPETAAKIADKLSQHPAFDWKNPNRFRSLIGGLTSNAAGFHAADGAGYRFVAEWLMRLDPKNPQTAARMSTAFDTWRRYDADRQDLIREQLNRIAAMTPISRDMGEMVGRMLNA